MFTNFAASIYLRELSSCRMPTSIAASKARPRRRRAFLELNIIETRLVAAPIVKLRRPAIAAAFSSVPPFLRYAAPSQSDPFHLILREPVFRAVIELGGARAFVRGHGLRVLKRAPVPEI